MAFSTVIVSRSPSPDDERRQFEDDLVAKLSSLGFDVLVTPHIYSLLKGDDAAAKIAALEGDLALAAWMFPRPAEWTLRYLGVAREADIVAVDMRDLCCSDKVADALTLLMASSRGEGGAVEEFTADAPDRWHPVLDYSKCIDCGQCFDFCLFGAYERDDEGHVTVDHPGNCKPGCPACARVCPKSAIMFPHYEADDAIAGAPGQFVKPGGFGASRPADSCEPCPACGCACDCQRSEDGTAPPGKMVCPVCGCICDPLAICECRGVSPAEAAEATTAARPCCGESSAPADDELDSLIDALDDLDG